MTSHLIHLYCLLWPSLGCATPANGIIKLTHHIRSQMWKFRCMRKVSDCKVAGWSHHTVAGSRGCKITSLCTTEALVGRRQHSAREERTCTHRSKYDNRTHVDFRQNVHACCVHSVTWWYTNITKVSQQRSPNLLHSMMNYCLLIIICRSHFLVLFALDRQLWWRWLGWMICDVLSSGRSNIHLLCQTNTLTFQF